jgi:hypothetical protein
LSGAVWKYEHRTKFLNRSTRAETPLAAPKEIKTYFDAGDFRLKAQTQENFES